MHKLFILAKLSSIYIASNIEFIDSALTSITLTPLIAINYNTIVTPNDFLIDFSTIDSAPYCPNYFDKDYCKTLA